MYNTKHTSKNKIDKFDIIKMNNFCISKNIVKKAARHLQKEWEKVFTNHILYK